MIQTAIIAFLLIGAMFIFTECGDSETKEVAKIEVDEEGIPTYVTEKAIDVSYTERDKEIATASYSKKEERNESSIPKNLNREKYSLATKENVLKTGTSHKTRDKEIALASYSSKGEVEEETLITEKNNAIDKEENVSSKVMTASETNSSETSPKEAEESPSDKSDIPVEKVVTASETNSSETSPKEAEESPSDKSDIPVEKVMTASETNSSETSSKEVEESPANKSDIVVPTAASIAVVSAVVATAVNSDSVDSVEKITLPNIPSVPEVNVTVPTAIKSKSMEEFASNSQVKKDLNAQRKAKDAEIAKNALLAKQLEEKIESEKLLKLTNQELASKIDELLRIAKEATLQAETKYAEGKKELETLLSEKESLEANVTQLKTTNDELSAKITELLSIAEEGTQKAQAAYESEKQEMQGLLLTKESLEANLRAEQENEKSLTVENIALQAKIAELLNIAKEGTQRALVAQEVEKEKMKALLLTKESLEGNVSKLNTTNGELAGKIVELLSIAEEGTKKIESSYASEKQEMQGLLSIKESLEANLTAELEKEKLLAEENSKLKEQLEAEHNTSVSEMQGLLSIKESLEANLTAELEKEKLLAEENSKLKEQLEAEHNASVSEMQGLLSIKESLEANLTAELEKEKLLAEENSKLKEQLEAEHNTSVSEMQGLLSIKESLEENVSKLKATNSELAGKIAELLSIVEEGTKKVEASYASEKQEIQGLLSTKKSLEANLTEELEKEKFLAEENDKLKNQLALLLEAKAKEEAKQLAAQKEAEEKAAEEKAKAEAKAKEEAERLVAQKEAEEKAAKEEEAKAKEAEKKLTDAFSLTKVEFRTGSMQLTNESKKRLTKAASVMKKYEGYSYKIQGHTDNRGSESFNIKLSKKRAEAVKAYLVSQGVDAGILSTEGLGSSQPIASNDTREGRFQNRRVVFEIIK